MEMIALGAFEVLPVCRNSLVSVNLEYLSHFLNDNLRCDNLKKSSRVMG